MMSKRLLTLAEKAVEIHASRHPRPSHVTLGQAAEMLSISRPTLQKLIKAGTIKMNKLGKVPVEEIDRALAPLESK